MKIFGKLSIDTYLKNISLVIHFSRVSSFLVNIYSVFSRKIDLIGIQLMVEYFSDYFNKILICVGLSSLCFTH